MKSISTLSLIIISLLITSCGNNTFDEIKVGMTYEEVESHLGRPIAIERGVNQLEIDYDKISSEIAFKANFDTFIDMSSKRWFAPNTIKKIGRLIYLNWVYDDSKLDTFYMILDRYAEKEETNKEKVPVYYLGSRKVSYQEYEKSKGIEYKLKDGRIVSQSYYKSYKFLNPNDVYEPVRVEKKIVYESIQHTRTVKEKVGIQKIYYLISYKNCILFDAASGRVVEKGYFPFSINIINQ